MTEQHSPETEAPKEGTSTAATSVPVGASTALAAADTGLQLTPPEAVRIVLPEHAAKAVQVDAATAERITSLVDSYIEQVVSTDPHDANFDRKIADVTTMGDREIKDYASTSNRLLERPMRSLDRGVLSDKAPVTKNLVDLRHTVESLNPEKHDLAHGGPRRILGVIPFGDRVRNYFDKYKDAQHHIDGIIAALRDGQDELVKDNASVEQEKQNLWGQVQRLRQYAFMAEQLDAKLEARIAEVERTDPERAKVLRSDVLFAIRQRHQDLLTQLAVDEQGYLALNLIKQNNVELIKGVDRATTTTVAALRTAVIVAQALTNQRLVLDQIRAVNEVTSTMIESTSVMLKEQTAQVHEQAAAASVDVAKLQTAFDNIFQTLDSIDTFKSQALDSMKVTITELRGQVDRAQGYLERAQAGPASGGTIATPGQGLALPAAPTTPRPS